jgi:putative cell wall-binding protein
VAYIANAYNFPDALGGAAAAGTVQGPVLLAAATLPIDPATTAELTRLKPARIIVLGGTGAISDAVKAALVPLATSKTVDRYGGSTRFETSADISAATWPTAGTAAVAYIANAYNFPDALGAAAAAGPVKGPVLLASATLPLDPFTAAELTRLQPARIVVVGGTSVISDEVKSALAPLATTHEVDRYSGTTRFATAADISFNTFSPGVAAIYLANAANFPDALGGAAAAGTLQGPVLLVSPDLPLDAATLAEIARLTPQHIYVLGGTAVVSDKVLDAVAAYPTGP